MTLTVKFIDGGRAATQRPDPDYPDGIDIDASAGRTPVCETALPYPAPRCGVLTIHCDVCGANIALTTAGRADDPRSLRIACKRRHDA
jgi:hypothetical protein